MSAPMVRTGDVASQLFAGAPGLLELRAFDVGPDARPAHRTFIQIDQPDRLAQFGQRQVADKFNLYWAVATRRDGSSGKLENARALPALYADYDGCHEGGTTQGVLDALNAVPCPPSLIIDSGGGLHVYWFLEAPIDLTTAAGKDHAYALLKRLAHELRADPACAEPARVLRVPNSKNFKYDPPRDVKVLKWHPERRYSLEALETWLPPLTDPAPSARPVNGTVIVTPFAAERDRVLRRARKFLEAIPPAIQGDLGDKHTLYVCAALVRGFDLSDVEVLELLRPWNARCVPRWSEAELETKIVNARKYGTEPIGGRLDDPRYARRRAPAQPQPDGASGPSGYVEAPPQTQPEPVAAGAHPYNQTDSGNAEYFAHYFGGLVRYDHKRGRYLVWQPPRWTPDADAQVRRHAKAAMRQRFREAGALDDPKARQHAATWAIGSESRSRLDALLYLAQAEPPIADAGEGWDAEPVLLGVPNGVVDLRTGVLRPATRDDRLTLLTSVPYDPRASSALWNHALRTILLDDDLIDFVQVAAGYSATGDTRRDCWFLACGNGRNGKGTLLQPIGQALGDYAMELPGSIFDLRSERSPYELARVPGKRFVTSSESGDTLRLHHDRIKQLTGGDRISAADKYEKSFEFQPACKLWLSCNKKPKATDDTAAFWARVLLIPFSVSFVGMEDRSLRPALVQDPVHQAAVLAWIVRGAVRYYAEGLEPPSIVRDAITEYREASDPLAAFVAEACEMEPGAVVLSTELYQHYERWADRQHYTTREKLTATKFGTLAAERFERGREPGTGRTLYRGIARREVAS